VIPPDDSISDEYDYLVGRDIHYPTQREILDLYSIFENIEISHFILKRQSIMNWLNNTCENDNQKQIIIQRHEETSTEYKRLANYQETEEDILVDIKHLMLLGRK
jgi:hypothetical protein